MNILFNFSRYGMIHYGMIHSYIVEKPMHHLKHIFLYSDIKFSSQSENFQVQKVVLIKKTH